MREYPPARVALAFHPDGEIILQVVSWYLGRLRLGCALTQYAHAYYPTFRLHFRETETLE